MTVAEYVANLNERYKTGISREHSYRGDLQTLLESMLDNVLVTNEPARIECGAPDYILTQKGVPVGYMEAKDIGEPLKGKKHKEQFDRYKESLPNLIITDYLDFHLYREGEFVASISIAEPENGSLSPKTEKFDQFKDLINDFATHTAQTITSSSKLSKMMAGKARLLSTIIENALKSDEDDNQVNESANNTLREQLEAFQNVLIHDIDAKEFADIYAQTIAYGMFAARLHDPTLDSFSRQEAAQLIPKTNPFLRKLFQYIAGYDLDERIDWVVDALADIFRATDVAALLKDFGKATQQNDPIIHFYETFLAEFDPDLRKSRGVWYTPEPVVNFIVRAVDDILKDEFDLSEGLADTSKTTVKVNTDVKDNRSSTGYRQEEKEVHKVQILDPAAGTGTFLAEVINQIHNKFEGQKGIWPSYVENHLIPRLNGFEILMASYAMAHLKLDMLLRETGYNREANQRFRIFLTNSLEEYHKDTGTLFAGWLSEEANQANRVKRDTPVMVVMGNPPYSVSSSNDSDWIEELMIDYKKDLDERNIQPLSDDYIKFIRFAQYFIEKNSEGILAYISNNSFIDGRIHRQMRKNLLKCFDDIFILDLHGSSMKNEVALDGSKDENVFDIQQGVSINLFVKNNNSNNLARIFHSDCYGKRDEKYSFLNDNNRSTIYWEQLEPRKPYYFFVPKDLKDQKSYESGFSLAELIDKNACGMVTARDKLLVQISKKEIKEIERDFKQLDEETFRSKYNDLNDSRDWKYQSAKDDLLENGKIRTVDYRPFDRRYIIYSENSKGVLSYPRDDIMKHMYDKLNYGLLVCKQQSTFDFQHVFMIKGLSDKCTLSTQTKEASYHFPLYLYPESNGQQTLDGSPERKPNLDAEIVQDIANGLDLTFTQRKKIPKALLLLLTCWIISMPYCIPQLP
ncbi:MAG: type ISP restriction/modification enzyme [Balneolaceae bacterium]|nr:type ISP restriction/modification enzyme [Balneolaceae bacterium]